MRKFWCLAVLISAASLVAADESSAARPMQLADILKWRSIRSPIVSPGGEWFAYQLAPREGDGEIVVKNLKNGAEQRFPAGELPALQFNPFQPVTAPRDLALSHDGKYVAFLSYPSAKEAKALKKQRKPIQAKAVVVELATNKKTEYEKIRRMSFNGERGTAIALHRHLAAPATPPAPAAPGAPPAQDDRPQGSDLLLVDLASGAETNLGNVSEFAFDKAGRWLAFLIDAQDKAGNGIQLRNMESGMSLALDSAKAVYKQVSWTETGDGLAVLRGVEDKAWEDKVYSLVAFRGFSNTGWPQKVTFDPAKDSSFPSGMTLSANRAPLWRKDLAAVTFGLAELKPKKKGAEPPKADAAKPEPTKPEPPKDEPEIADLVLWHWKDKRLQSMQQVQENQDKNFSYLALYRVADKKFLRLADEEVRQVAMQPYHKYAVGFDVRSYELASNLGGQRLQDVYAVNPETGERKLALKKTRWSMGPSPDGTHLLYYDDGAFYTLDMGTGKSYNITKDIPATFWDTEDDHNVQKPPTQVIGWSADSSFVLLSDDWDIWKAPVHGGAGVNLTANGKKDKVRYQRRYRLDPDEKGIDLAKPMYVEAYGEWTKKSGIALIEPGKTGVKMLTWDDARYGQLLKAKDAEVYLSTRETTQDFPNYRVSDATLANAKSVTDANPQQKEILWSKGSRLVDYVSAKGDNLQGALYLPANYEPGKKYPTIVYIYEKLSQQLNNYSMPAFNGFNIANYTSNGYAVFTPDIVYKLNDPGMSAVWCVLPGLKAAVETGVVDPKKVGLHGHSWGGYQTSFLVTQTDAFRAAIAGAPLTDMVSMYSSIYWNTGSANQPIFESSQGRFTSGYWDNPEAYVRNSPVYHAKNVKTPLVILHNDKDGAVDFTQGIEYYNTLRRLEKPVVMLQYKGENHGLVKPENMKDYTVRMREFFENQLNDRMPPKWWTEGVPHLKMKEHLEERSKELAPKPAAAAATAGSRL